MAPIPKAIGLNDPRVDICFDRGNHYYDADHPIKRRNTEIKPQDGGPQIFRTVRRELEAKIVKKGNNYFIPRGCLHEIFTPGRLLAVIQQLWKKMTGKDQQKLCHRVLYEVRCWKVFLLFILTKNQKLLPQLWEEESDKGDDLRLSDRCLPLISIDSEGLIKCQNKHHPSHQFPGWEEDDLSHCQRNSFEQVSYALNAVYFKLPRGGLKTHVHYCLGPRDVLPYNIIPCTSLSDSRLADGQAATAGKTGGTKDKGDPTQNENPNGGFGEISRVNINASHYSFGQLGSDDGESTPSFAVKRLYASDEDAFDKELASLISVEADEGAHLINLLTTFSVEEEDGRKMFYLVFPWAEGTLWDYWERNSPKDKQERLSQTPWMAHQCHGLARALQCVHNERKQHLKQYPELISGKDELYGRHGDIKAENVLYFKGNRRLVLSDFGLGRLQTKYSRSNNNPKALEKSATYRAPEFDLPSGLISRASDVFSLGCMFLEFVTWYLMGYEAASDEFSDFRMDMDTTWGFESDTFFTIEDGKPKIKPKVQRWILKLKEHEDASAYTAQFLEIIEEMLHPSSKERINVATLARKLKLLRETCERDPSYYGALLS